MPVDSTADLLFRIGANSDDAEGNLLRFRSLMGKSLSDISGDFSDWSNHLFGDLSTLQGAMTAAMAALAAGVVAAGAAMVAESEHYATYVSEVERGSKATGISVENMSGLKFAAEETGTSYDSLVTGLTRFASTIVKAAGGSQQQLEAFERLGITQEQVKAGEKDMMPLLELVADRFHRLGSQVDKTAEARDLFSRGGQALVRMLSLGSEGLRQFEQECQKLGLTVHMTDVVEVEHFKATTKATEAQMESLGYMIGRFTEPILQHFKEGVMVVAIALKDLPRAIHGDFWSTFKQDLLEARERTDALARALANMPDNSGAPLEHTAEAAKEMVRDFRGFDTVLDAFREKIADAAGGEAKVTEETRRLNEELIRSTEEFQKWKKEGTHAPAAIQWQMALLAEAQAKLPEAIAAVWKQYTTTQDESVKAASLQLQQELLRQGQQTMAIKVAEWELEIAARRAKLQKDKTDTAANLAELAELERAGYEKVENEAAAAITQGQETIDAEIEAHGEQAHEKRVAEWNRHIAELGAQMAKVEDRIPAHWERLEELRKVGLDKIDADEKAAADTELARLQGQLERIESEQQTHGQRIVAEYNAEAARFAAAEEKKTLALATGEEDRARISQMFAAIRKGLLDKESADLQSLQNSTGWQGVFGGRFAEMIRGNENLLKQWQSSTNQSTMLVKVTLEGLKEQGQKTFDQLAQGMGQNIAHSLIYSKTIGQAMKSMLESTLESLSAQAITYAIFSTALGFTDLAEQNYPGADAAFTAAAIWASVGGAAAVAGRAMAGSQGGSAPSGSGAGSGGPSGSPGQSTGSTVPAPGGASGPHVTVNFYGHVLGTSGAAEVCNMLTDAVVNGGASLTAKDTLTGVQVQR